MVQLKHSVITILYHTVAVEGQSLYHVGEKMTARLNGERLYVDALWFKVTRIHISPKLV
jgi:hypothetical protein